MKTLLAVVLLISFSATAQDSKTFVYKKTPQGELTIEVYYPPNWKAADQRPAIVFFFGGGWTNGQRSQFYPQCQYLASRGMVAATADYRINSKHKTSPDKCVEDGKSAVRWMRQHAAELGVDPKRVAAGGGSAGGHVAACTATTPGLDAQGEDLQISSKPDALVLFPPVMRMPESYADRLIGKTDDAKKMIEAISPNAHLAKDTVPLIMFFGSNDRLRAYADETLELSKKLGNRSEMHLAPNQGHGFFNKPPWTNATLREADKFLTSLKFLEGDPTIKENPAAALQPAK